MGNFRERLDSRMERVNWRLGIRLIAYAFILDHCYGRTHTLATAILRTILPEPSTPLSRGAYFAPKAVPFLGLRTCSMCIPSFNFSEDERNGSLCLGLVLEGINRDGIYGVPEPDDSNDRVRFILTEVRQRQVVL